MREIFKREKLEENDDHNHGHDSLVSLLGVKQTHSYKYILTVVKVTNVLITNQVVYSNVMSGIFPSVNRLFLPGFYSVIIGVSSFIREREECM